MECLVSVLFLFLSLSLSLSLPSFSLERGLSAERAIPPSTPTTAVDVALFLLLVMYSLFLFPSDAPESSIVDSIRGKGLRMELALAKHVAFKLLLVAKAEGEDGGGKLLALKRA